MKQMTIKGRLMTERLLERRVEFFSGIESLTDEQVEMVSDKWHRIANRYQKWVAKITVRRMMAEGKFNGEAN